MKSRVPVRLAAGPRMGCGHLVDWPDRRRELSRTARHVVDGRGAERAARHLEALIVNVDSGVPVRARVSRRLVA